ncbi:MAG: T9SS type A sorting domain-containing protein [Mobilitalea sp.]
MRKFYFPFLFFIVFVKPTNSQVIATFNNDTTKIWDTNYMWNCVLTSKSFFPIVTVSRDTIYITECDTSSSRMLCICKYNSYTSLVGLDTGTYTAVVTRQLYYHTKMPVETADGWIFKDTTINSSEEAGSVTFTLMTTSNLQREIGFYQSGCLNSTDVILEKNIIPNKFAMLTNYPNPFNPSTSIRYTIPKLCHVALSIYNLIGQQITTLVNEKQQAGSYEVNYNMRDLSSGIYICRLSMDGNILSHKIMLLK